MVSSVLWLDVTSEWEWDHHRICSGSAFIKQDMDHQNGFSTGYSSTDVLQESLFLQKKCAPTRSTESGIFRCYSQLRRAQ